MTRAERAGPTGVLLAAPPKFVFASSLAVFGGPLPEKSAQFGIAG